VRAHGAAAIDVRPEVEAASDRAVQQQFAGTAWTRCDSWYRDDEGRIVANWPGGASAARAGRLGLQPHANFAEIIRQYIDDCAAAPNADQTLKGLSR